MARTLISVVFGHWVVPSADMDHGERVSELPNLYLEHDRVLFTSLYCCSNWVIWSWSSDLTWLLSDNWEVNDSRSVVVFSFKASKVSMWEHQSSIRFRGQIEDPVCAVRTPFALRGHPIYGPWAIISGTLSLIFFNLITNTILMFFHLIAHLFQLLKSVLVKIL